MNKKKIISGTISFLALAGLVTLQRECFKSIYAPKYAIVSVEDLNKDGLPDLVIQQQNGHMTPMYCVDDGGIKYVSAKEMKTLHPELETNYKGIEATLNNK